MAEIGSTGPGMARGTANGAQPTMPAATTPALTPASTLSLPTLERPAEKLVSRLKNLMLPDSIRSALASLGDNPEIARQRTSLESQIGALDAQLAAALAQRRATSGGGPNAGGANAAPDMAVDDAAVASLAQKRHSMARENLKLQVQNMKWQLGRISQSMPRRMAAGAALAPISARNAVKVSASDSAQAEALADRLTIDMVTAVGRLDVIKAELDLAHYDLSVSATAENRGRVAELTRRYNAQYVEAEGHIEAYEKRAEVADPGSSGGANLSMQDVREAKTEEATTGRSRRLDSIRKEIIRQILVDDTMNRARADEQRSEREDERAREQKAIDKRVNQRRLEREMAEQAAAARRQRFRLA